MTLARNRVDFSSEFDENPVARVAGPMRAGYSMEKMQGSFMLDRRVFLKSAATLSIAGTKPLWALHGDAGAGTLIGLWPKQIAPGFCKRR
jgi:hypothetical protein